MLPLLQSALLGPLRPLGTLDREVLVHAAVIGQNFDLDVLAATVGQPVDEVRAVLQRGCDVRLIEPHPSVPERFAFRNALTRDAICAELLESRLRPLHRRVVGALERCADVRPVQLDQLAHHAWAAGDRRRGPRYSELAGDRAGARRDYDEALIAYKRALELLAPRSNAELRVRAKIRLTEAREALA